MPAVCKQERARGDKVYPPSKQTCYCARMTARVSPPVSSVHECAGMCSMMHRHALWSVEVWEGVCA